MEKFNSSLKKKLKSISRPVSGLIFQSKYKIKNLKKFKGKKLLAFAGIGKPENFFRLLRENGLKVKHEVSFPDHYNYERIEIKNLIELAKERKLKLVTTEKDYFRIKDLGFKKIDYVSIDLKINKYNSFEKEVL